MLFFLTFILIFFFLFFHFILNKKSKFNKNKSTIFECGFEPFSKTRLPFSLRFFKLCLIFIFFDIEIIIILPLPMIINSSFLPVFFFFNIITIIFLSLIFEWKQNSLNWMF